MLYVATDLWDRRILRLRMTKIRVNSHTIQLFLERVRCSLESSYAENMLIDKKSFSPLTVSISFKRLSSSFLHRLQMNYFKLDRDRPSCLASAEEAKDVRRKWKRIVLRPGFNFEEEIGVSEYVLINDIPHELVE